MFYYDSSLYAHSCFVRLLRNLFYPDAERRGILLIKKSYELSQVFKNWYDKKYSREVAKKRLQYIYKEIEETSYRPLIEAIETIKRHEGGILNYFKNRATNAYAESLNSKIKLFKTLVRGINKPKYFIFRLATYIT